MTQHQRVDKRKILLFLPLLLLPFLALAFYALGGGKGVRPDGAPASQGINTRLPDAAFKKPEQADKLAIYNEAGKDTARSDGNAVADVAGRLGFNRDDDPQTKQINEKLAAIHQQINAPVPPSDRSYAPVQRSVGAADVSSSQDVAKLEAMMKAMQQHNGGDDPEMKQLSGMMDKILQIQNPELVKQSLQKETKIKAESEFKAIPAEISRNQKVTDGAVVELRLLDTLKINGQIVPKGQLIYGLASISNQRLNLEIKNIGLGTAIVPVNLTVFDKKDAMIGVNAPEAELGGAVSGGASNAVQSMQFLSMDQSLGVQAAGAGVEAAKGLFSKKVKRIKVRLKEGYPLLLRDNAKKNKQ